MIRQNLKSLNPSQVYQWTGFRAPGARWWEIHRQQWEATPDRHQRKRRWMGLRPTRRVA